MAIKNTIRNEQAILRTELQELKKCQLQYFLLSVAGAGAVFGLSDAIPLSHGAKSAVLFAPLVILIPCWWTFFDKATTITRLVGYMRFLEEQLRSSQPFYIGYENALAFFRCEEERNPATTAVRLTDWRKWPEVLSLFVLRTRHRYWMINWYTFFILSILCCIIPLLSRWGEQPRPALTLSAIWLPRIAYACLVIVLISGLYTLRGVINLTIGRYSYDNVSDYWHHCLSKFRESHGT